MTIIDIIDMLLKFQKIVEPIDRDLIREKKVIRSATLLALYPSWK